VLGVDLAEQLLALARTKAAQRGLTNIEFRTGDMLDLKLASESFDAVVCVFGIFFVPDMVAVARELWRMVAPGGMLAVTTWGPRWFEPMSTQFWNAVRAERPDLYRGFNPWDRITQPDELRAVLTGAGVTDPEIEPESGFHPIPTQDAWWMAVLATGYRGTIAALSPDEIDRVRSQNFEYIRQEGITEVESNVIYAVARKPA
jgi:2-polyprenyl-3-methyl-5-hydroxy-6-metoxy-1,4-benzoquinol methylase